jgi:hypothetical protein
VPPVAVRGDPVKVPRAFTARADRSSGRTAARSPRRRVFRTEAPTCKHCAPAGRADAVPATAPVAIVATTAATTTSFSTSRSLKGGRQTASEPLSTCEGGTPPGITTILTIRVSSSVKRSAKSRSYATAPVSHQRAISRVRAMTSPSTSSNSGSACSVDPCLASDAGIEKRGAFGRLA